MITADLDKKCIPLARPLPGPHYFSLKFTWGSSADIFFCDKIFQRATSPGKNLQMTDLCRLQTPFFNLLGPLYPSFWPYLWSLFRSESALGRVYASTRANPISKIKKMLTAYTFLILKPWERRPKHFWPPRTQNLSEYGYFGTSFHRLFKYLRFISDGYIYY